MVSQLFSNSLVNSLRFLALWLVQVRQDIKKPRQSWRGYELVIRGCRGVIETPPYSIAMFVLHFHKSMFYLLINWSNERLNVLYLLIQNLGRNQQFRAVSILTNLSRPPHANFKHNSSAKWLRSYFNKYRPIREDMKSVPLWVWFGTH